jgi:FlaA1/EpsC-like NDP-sugar epimerase
MALKLRTLSIVAIDLVLVVLSSYLALHLRWEGEIPVHIRQAYLSVLPWITVCRLVLFQVFGLYNWSFRYASFSEAVRVFKAVSTGSVIFITLMFMLGFRRFFGRFMPVVDFLLCLFLILGFRFVFRLNLLLSRRPRKRAALPRVLVVGAGRSGEGVVRELVNAKDKHYQVVGFVDDDPAKRRHTIHGVEVLGPTGDIAGIARKHAVDEIIIAIPSAPGKVVRDLISACRKSNVRFKIIPGLQKILSGKVEMKRVRDVRPEDLLGRETVSVNDSEVRSCLENRAVLVTGAGGSIGSELVRQAARYRPRSLVLFDFNENDVFFLENDLRREHPELDFDVVIGDIKDVSLLKYTFARTRPEVVFHAAAHKHVPLMEANPAAAVKNNILGTRNLIYAAEHYRVDRFVLISTDKAVNPTSVMGASKRVVEMLCQAKAKIGRTKYMAVRFGNVIGSNGSVVQLFKRQIEQEQSLSVTHPEIKRFFMTVGEAVLLVLQASAMGKGGELFVLDMGEQIRIADLALNLITLSGLELDRDLSIEFTGLRPGEKLYEEVLHDSETDQATRHDRIFIARPETFDIRALNRDIDELKRLSRSMDREAIVEKLKQIVPAYRPTPNA